MSLLQKSFHSSVVCARVLAIFSWRSLSTPHNTSAIFSAVFTFDASISILNFTFDLIHKVSSIRSGKHLVLPTVITSSGRFHNSSGRRTTLWFTFQYLFPFVTYAHLITGTTINKGIFYHQNNLFDLVPLPFEKERGENRYP